MKICFYFPSLANDQNHSIFGSMYKSFFNSIEELGHIVTFTTDFESINGDILITNIGSGYEKTAAKAMLSYNGPVVLSTYNAYINFNPTFLKRWKSRILFAYNPDYASLNFKKYNSLGIPYLHLPLASDPEIFKPLLEEKKYDISFLGNAHSGYGREKYIQKLIEYSKRKNLNLFLAGAGWEKFGYTAHIVNHGYQTNQIYNQSKVCINIHNDRQYAGIDKEMDANNRLFDLAMAGCCQVSNGHEMIKKYFSQEEIATADNPDEWIELIDYYLSNQEERSNLGDKARLRAITEHTWEKRAIEFLNFITSHMNEYNERSQKISLPTAISRYLDSKHRPAYQIIEIRLIRYILTFFGLYTKK